jgi:hypothetical protein
MCRLAREQSLVERLLDRVEDLRLRFRQIARETSHLTPPGFEESTAEIYGGVAIGS